MHFHALQEEVFSRLNIDLGSADPNLPHGMAISHLHWLAAAGSERQKSVCLGITFALLSIDWDKNPTSGYWDYMVLLRTLDVDEVAVRTLAALVRRCESLNVSCRVRLVERLGDMAESRWPNAEAVFLCLQREVHPGALWPGFLSILSSLMCCALRCTSWLAVDDKAVRLSFIWALRWIRALKGPATAGHIEGVTIEDVRRTALELAVALWRQSPSRILKAGPAVAWALMHCRNEVGLEDACQQASGLALSPELAQECLDHLLASDEQEHLAFLLAVERHEERYFEWFMIRYLKTTVLGNTSGGTTLGSSTHLADVTLCALTAAEGAGCPRPRLWSRFWELAGWESRLAFLFAARNPGYGRVVLTSVLDSDPNPEEARASIRRLAQDALPAKVLSDLMPSLGTEDNMTS